MSDEIVEQVQVPGATLWTVSGGAGLPAVLCHGGPGLSDNLGPVAEMVEDLALVHRYDQRGSGRSRSSGPFDVDSFVADLDALRRHWGHDRWLVGGHSWGANLALFYALRHPDRTLGVLYLAGTGLHWVSQEAARRRRRARLTDDERAELAQLQERLRSGDADATQRFLRLIWTTDFADRERATVLDRQPLYEFARDEVVFGAVSESHKRLLDAGVEDQLRRLEAPVLVVHGAHDTDPARARRVAELALHGRWVELERSAHLPWLEQPEELRKALRGFVEALTDRF
jgi:proline iminopeptidase